MAGPTKGTMVEAAYWRELMARAAERGGIRAITFADGSIVVYDPALRDGSILVPDDLFLGGTADESEVYRFGDDPPLLSGVAESGAAALATATAGYRDFDLSRTEPINYFRIQRPGEPEQYFTLEGGRLVPVEQNAIPAGMARVVVTSGFAPIPPPASTDRTVKRYNRGE